METRVSEGPGAVPVIDGLKLEFSGSALMTLYEQAAADRYKRAAARDEAATKADADADAMEKLDPGQGGIHLSSSTSYNNFKAAAVDHRTRAKQLRLDAVRLAFVAKYVVVGTIYRLGVDEVRDLY